MKIVNIVLAIGTLIILGALISLGIAAFYPAPTPPTYPNVPTNYPMIPVSGLCHANDVQCLAQSSSTKAYQTQIDQYNQNEQVYRNAMDVYGRNLFIIANLVGILVFIAGFFIVLYAGLASQGVPVGIMMAGLWSIIYGYARGWGSIDDQLKFFVGLVVAVIVIGGSMWLMQRHDTREAR